MPTVHEQPDPHAQVQQQKQQAGTRQSVYASNSHDSSNVNTTAGYTSKGDASKAQMYDNTASTEDQLKEFYQLIHHNKLAMMATRASDGSLAARPMQTLQIHANGVDLWFITNSLSHKLDDIKNDPMVNISYIKAGTAEWASVSGRAQIVQDTALVERMWNDGLQMWFGDLGDGVHDGGPKDPRIALILVQPLTVHYQVKSSSAPVLWYNKLKSSFTHQPPVMGTQRDLSFEQLQEGRQAGATAIAASGPVA